MQTIMGKTISRILRKSFLFIKTCVQLLIQSFYLGFGKLLFPSHLEKYIIKIGKISTKIHEIGKNNFWIGNDSHIRR